MIMTYKVCGLQVKLQARSILVIGLLLAWTKVGAISATK